MQFSFLNSLCVLFTILTNIALVRSRMNAQDLKTLFNIVEDQYI